MRRLSLLIVAVGIFLASLPIASANAENCDEPGGCCKDVVVLGKITVLQICPE
jgi:hypothetical protein